MPISSEPSETVVIVLAEVVEPSTPVEEAFTSKEDVALMAEAGALAMDFVEPASTTDVAGLLDPSF